MNFLKNIQNKIISILVPIFNKKKFILNNINYQNSTTKKVIGANYTVELSTKTKQKQEEIENQVKDIVVKYIKDSEGLINHLKTYNINIYRISNAEKILEGLNEEQGFITPQKGKNAFLLNNLIRVFQGKSPQIKLKTEPLFIFDTKNVEIYTVARALYKYYGFKNELPGYEYKAQQAYKKSSHRKENIFKGFSPADIFACKEAMTRDMESINFTIKLSVEYENSKKASQKITDDGANI